MWGLLPDSAIVGTVRRVARATNGKPSRTTRRYNTPRRWEDTVEFRWGPDAPKQD